MAVRQYRPTSPGRRGMSVSKFEEITRSKPERSLLVSLSKTAGRNNRGHITTRHRGGGAKRQYRIIDFKRNKPGVPAKVFSIEYDPNRSARIALLQYLDGEKRYILAPNGLKVGDRVMSRGQRRRSVVGNALPLRNIPTGTVIHNIELYPGRGGQMVRSAGAAGAVDGERRRLRPGAPAFGRAAPGLDELYGNYRPGGQSRSRECLHRQGWPLAAYGQAARMCVARR